LVSSAATNDAFYMFFGLQRSNGRGGGCDDVTGECLRNPAAVGQGTRRRTPFGCGPRGGADVPIHGVEGPCGAFAESAKEAFLEQTRAGASEASPIACPGEVGALLVSDECTAISSPSGIEKRRLQEDGGIVESPSSLKRMRVKTDDTDSHGVQERMQPATLGA